MSSGSHSSAIPVIEQKMPHVKHVTNQFNLVLKLSKEASKICSPAPCAQWKTQKLKLHGPASSFIFELSFLRLLLAACVGCLCSMLTAFLRRLLNFGILVIKSEELKSWYDHSAHKRVFANTELHSRVAWGDYEVYVPLGLLLGLLDSPESNLSISA